MNLMSKAPVVFLQYLAALAVVEGVQAYEKGYKDVPVKLKWPNDVCECIQSYSVHTLMRFSVMQATMTDMYSMQTPSTPAVLSPRRRMSKLAAFSSTATIPHPRIYPLSVSASTLPTLSPPPPYHPSFPQTSPLLHPSAYSLGSSLPSLRYTPIFAPLAGTPTWKTYTTITGYTLDRLSLLRLRVG